MSLPMRLPMCLFLPLFSLLVVVSPAAQERTAMQAQTMQSMNAAANEAVLLQKVSYLTQLVKILEDQLHACAAGQGVTCPSVLPDPTQAQASTETTTFSAHNSHAQVSSAPVSVPATSAPAPVRRTTMGYQQSSDSRLGCDDYSLSYFRRHPAMAAVCGVNAQQQAPAVQPVAPQTAPQVSPTENDGAAPQTPTRP